MDALRHKPTAYTDNAPSFWHGLQEVKVFEPAPIGKYQLIEPPFEPEINLKDFGLGWDFTIVLKQGAKNTEQANQPDSEQ